MRPISTIQGTMLPLDLSDVDTDQIIPQQFLKRVERSGYGEYLFYGWARDLEGEESDFPTNRPLYRNATVLITGPNFGCGSSREHAVWALMDWGIEAVVAPSVADIFRNNAHQAGLLVVELPEPEVRRLLAEAADPRSSVLIDLTAQTLATEGLFTTFEIESAARERLLLGIDHITETLGHETAIRAHESDRPAWMPASRRDAS